MISFHIYNSTAFQELYSVTESKVRGGEEVPHFWTRARGQLLIPKYFTYSSEMLKRVIWEAFDWEIVEDSFRLGGF